MYRVARQNLNGVAHKAIAGVELALWDLKAKALGVPVYELLGGPIRERIRLYWSHCGTTRPQRRPARAAAPPDVRRRRRAGSRGRAAGLHGAEDEYRRSGRAGRRLLTGIRRG